MTRFADAIVQRDEPALGRARQALVDEMDSASMVDAAGVASNFQRMVRIADGTGISLDGPMLEMSSDLRDNLGINDYAAASRTKKNGPLKRLALRWLVAPKMQKLMRSRSPME